MNKIVILSVVAMLGAVLQGKAQSAQMPQIKKFVEVTATGVNFRQQPSTLSKKLGIFLDEGMEYGWFSNNEPFNEYNRIMTRVLPVTGESGDWYQVHLSFAWDDEGGVMYSSFTAYIMKKFCRDISQKPIRLPAPDKDIEIVTSGKYNRLCLYLDENGGNNDCLRIGKYQDGMFIFDRYIYVWGNVGKYYQERGSHFQKDVNYGFTRFIFDDNVANEYHKLSLEKLVKSESTLNLLMGSPSKLQPMLIGFYGVEGYPEWYLLLNE